MAAQKIEAVRNTVPGALHLGKREAEAKAQPWGPWGWSGLGSPLVSGHPIGGGLIQNPISGAITPDYTPAQKIEAVRNTVPGALHLGKREAEAEAYYGYGGYGATIGLHGRNPSAYTGPAYGAVVIGKREAEAGPTMDMAPVTDLAMEPSTST